VLALVAPVLLLGGLTACEKDSDDPPAGAVPDGATLLAEAATAMTEVETTHVVLDIDPAIPGGLPISRAEGDLTKEGDAAGAIQLLVGAQLIEVEFRILEDEAWLKYPTGGWTNAEGIMNIYDPSLILDADRGVANLLSTATNPRTDGSEEVDGVDAWRVLVDIDTDAAKTLVPGVPDGLTGTVWIDKAAKHLVKAVVNAPASGAAQASTITLELTDINAPVDISAP
jgi:lipoprotein LprG